MELLLLVLVLAIAAFVGFRVYNKNSSATSPPVSTSVSSTTQTVPAINNQSDLNKAAETLNSQDIDSNLNPDNYNQDVNSLY